jgi:hypothetical protein
LHKANELLGELILVLDVRSALRKASADGSLYPENMKERLFQLYSLTMGLACPYDQERGLMTKLQVSA